MSTLRVRLRRRKSVARRGSAPHQHAEGRACATVVDRASEIRLELEGMSCAACAARIERKLNKLEGVDASVNFATERATVQCDSSVTVEALVAAVESAGYHAHTTDLAHAAHHHEEPPLSAGASHWQSP